MVRAPMPAGADEQHRAPGPWGLLNITQVAQHLGVSTATVYALCDRNELKHLRVANAIRISPTDLAAFISAAAAAPRKRRRSAPRCGSESVPGIPAAPPSAAPPLQEPASAATPPPEGANQ